MSSVPFVALPLCGALVCSCPSQDPGSMPPGPPQEPRPQEPPPSRSESLEAARRALAGAGSPGAAPSQAAAGAPPSFQLLDVSLDVLTAVGTSTARDDVLRQLQAGAHDPRQRGFTLQQAELSLLGAVDPWFRLEAHVITALDAEDGETIVELEEAFATSQSLPAGLQLEVGHFFTEFGRVNAVHPHAWDWQDQPVIHSRVFGGDGMRGPGARLSWLLPTDTFLELAAGVQDASGETMHSFGANEEVYEEGGIGGRFFAEREVRSWNDMVWTTRLATSVDLGEATTLGLGASAAFGPNATGADADTIVYGADFALLWRPVQTDKGWPFVKVQGEVVARDFDAAAQIDANDPTDPLDDVALPRATLRDRGGYLQVLYGFERGFAAGLRGEWAGGSGASYDAATDAFSRDGDPARSDRLRLSPLFVWQPSEFSRIRLQYNYDDSDHLDDPEHSVWLGFEFLIGKHPAHTM